MGEPLQFHPVLAELNPAGTALLFSTCLARRSYDSGSGIAVDPTGTNIYFAGTTFSSDFPTQASQLTAYDGFANGFTPASAGTTLGSIQVTVDPPSPGGTVTVTLKGIAK